LPYTNSQKPIEKKKKNSQIVSPWWGFVALGWASFHLLTKLENKNISKLKKIIQSKKEKKKE
jgi:hypothetical protein